VRETPDESDQLPEEAPPEVVPEDDPGADKGESPSPGVPGEEETSTGNPDNAGTEE
jgi:hypothetical protein